VFGIQVSSESAGSAVIWRDLAVVCVCVDAGEAGYLYACVRHVGNGMGGSGALDVTGMVVDGI
jgi:hypothetical protein